MFFTISRRLKSAGNLRLNWHMRVPGWLGITFLLIEGCIYLCWYSILACFWIMYGMAWLICLPFRLILKRRIRNPSTPSRSVNSSERRESVGKQSRKAQIIKIAIGAIFTLLAFAMDTPATVLVSLAFGLPLLAWGILPEFLSAKISVLASVGAFILLFGLAVALPADAPETAPEPTAQTESVSRSIGSQTADVPPDTTVALQTVPPVTTTAAAPAESTTQAATTAPATTTPATTQATSAASTTATTTAATTTAAPQTTTAATTTTTATTAATTTTTAAPETTTTTAATTTATTTTAATKAYHAPTNATNVIEVDGTNQCYPGEIITCKYYGLPNTQYHITVRYKTKNAEAQGLEDKTSGTDGFVSWTWKIGPGTSAGTFDVTIVGADDKAVIPFTIVKSN